MNKHEEQISLQLKLSLHTIVLLIGPDGSGKSIFSSFLLNKIKESLFGSKKNIKINRISYDDIAFDLLGASYSSIDKKSYEFEQIREQAESLLFAKLLTHTSYPVSSEFIVIDAVSLSVEFINKIISISEEQHYNVSAVIFDFKNRAEYGKLTGTQVKELKNIVSGGISLKKFNSTLILKEKNDFLKLQLIIDNALVYENHILEGNPSDYFIIGDIHGCYKELVALIESQGFVIDSELRVTHPNGKKIILVGDLIDKGYDIESVIELAYVNKDNFFMVIGNHESFVYRVLKGLIPGTSVSDLVKREFFHSIDLFLENEVLREKFFSVFESMKGFYMHEKFLVTHSPCESKFIGKLTPEALRNMRDFKYPKSRDYESFAEFIYEFDELLDYMKSEAREHLPLHIFGHVVTSEVSKYKNKISIDTGCASGGKLTGIYVLPYGKVAVVSEKSITNAKENHKFYNFFNIGVNLK